MLQGYLKQFPQTSKDFSCRICLLSQELIISFDRKDLPWKRVFWRDRPEKHSFLSGELYFLQFSSVQSLSRIQLSVTPWSAAHQIFLFITNSQSLYKLMSIDGHDGHSCQWCHLIISSSVIPFSSHLQSFPESESFQISQLKRLSIPWTCKQNVWVPFLCLNLGF